MAAPAAVDLQGLPGDVAGGIAGREQQRTVEFVGSGGRPSGALAEIQATWSGSCSHPVAALGKNDGARALTRTPRPHHC